MLSSLRNFTLTVTRKSGAYVNGIWADSDNSTFTIIASVQPLTQNEMQSLPEARRESVGYTLYTDTNLRTARQAETPAIQADIVTIDSEEYEVYKVEKWQNAVISHYKAIVLRIEQ